MNARHPLLSQRPAVAIGHIGPVLVSNISAATRFYADLGMRVVISREQMAILELRGGTHLILREGPTTSARVGFDLMVDDIEQTRRDALDRGLTATEIRRGGIHSTFHLIDPDGRSVSVTSSHAMGEV